VEDVNQILLEPNRYEHYLLALWLNLSARKLSLDDSSWGEMENYFETFFRIIDGDRLRPWLELSDDQRKQFDVIYLHAKLVRNMTQFFEPQDSDHTIVILNYTSSWQTVLIGNISILLKQENSPLGRAILVEFVAIVTNFLEKIDLYPHEERPVEMYSKNLIELGGLLESLLKGYLKDMASMNAEDDDLLLVITLFVGTLSKQMEICHQLNVTRDLFDKLIELNLFIYNSRSTDPEMMVCCLFALSKLLNHSEFYDRFNRELPISTNGSEVDGSDCLKLIRKSSYMLLDGQNVPVNRLVNEILNKLKEHEEHSSLEDPLVGQIRFKHYNENWLEALDSSNSPEMDSCCLDVIHGEEMNEKQDELGHEPELGGSRFSFHSC